jgi:hypothetical protein
MVLLFIGSPSRAPIALAEWCETAGLAHSLTASYILFNTSLATLSKQWQLAFRLHEAVSPRSLRVIFHREKVITVGCDKRGAQDLMAEQLSSQ